VIWRIAEGWVALSRCIIFYATAGRLGRRWSDCRYFRRLELIGPQAHGFHSQERTGCYAPKDDPAELRYLEIRG
jgi:hypothetical protein